MPKVVGWAPQRIHFYEESKYLLWAYRIKFTHKIGYYVVMLVEALSVSSLLT